MSRPAGTASSWNVREIAYADLEGHAAFKMAIHRFAGRWYLYLTPYWESGLMIVEITEPENPRFVRFIAGPPEITTLQIQIADGLMITSLEAIPPEFGGKPGPHEHEGFVVWSLIDPENPQKLGHFRTNGSGTHRNYFDGGRYVYATGLPDGFDGHILQIVDISDPANPVEVSRWWRDGQWRGGGEAGVPAGTLLHGGAYVRGDRAYLPYSAGGFVILDISDKTKPALVSDLPFSPPFQSFIAVHTAQPLTARSLVIVNSEPTLENCDGSLGYVGIVDVAEEVSPRLISLFPLPEPPFGSKYRNFCQKGGRFGPHNQHQWQYQDVLLHDENRVFMAYFNAGLRVFDISDEYLPKEIAYFIPPDPATRRGPLPKSKLVAQSEDVLVDSRGFIYVTDKNQGLYVLRVEDSLVARRA
jgi:hypothetical protein